MSRNEKRRVMRRLSLVTYQAGMANTREAQRIHVLYSPLFDAASPQNKGRLSTIRLVFYPRSSPIHLGLA